MSTTLVNLIASSSPFPGGFENMTNIDDGENGNSTSGITKIKFGQMMNEFTLYYVLVGVIVLISSFIQVIVCRIYSFS